ncbi:hypothetical protein MJG53_001756 [Ovis ammon polii x Ovis aries]|uniref:Uncharacterized protein n=1 Tax=Ovis ammon polii x Ovis aries TaxID=2918886 RepID=A0ACB9VLX9_9CETA|nr:hypothetical protein MJG53_001756 [Ovis ammon polii x Ovis aries]
MADEAGLDLNMELPQGQTGSVGTSVASAERDELSQRLARLQDQKRSISFKYHLITLKFMSETVFLRTNSIQVALAKGTFRLFLGILFSNKVDFYENTKSLIRNYDNIYLAYTEEI